MPIISTNPDSSLAAIQQEVRSIVRMPSENQLSTSELNNFINAFLVQDFPEHVRHFNLHTVFEFYTTPLVADYSTTTIVPTDPLYNFTNKYLSVSGPIYFAGIQGQLVQDRTTFFTYYPQNTFIQNIGYGDGATQTFSGTTSSQPLLQNSVLFNSADIDGNQIALIDFPFNPLSGALGIPNAPQTIPSPYGFIDYPTGTYSVTFPAAPAANIPINVQYFAYQPSRPIVALFYDGIFSLRPVPDQVYKVSMDAYMQPMALLNETDNPQIWEWWTYVAYGTARRIFARRLDTESLQLIQPIFEEQQALIMRRTIKQNTNQRVKTIYEYANQAGAVNGWNGFGQY